MNIRSRMIAIFAITVIGVAAGCGSSSDESSPEAQSESAAASIPSPSKAQFITQANAACEKARAGLAGRVSDFEQRREGRKPLAGADMVHFVYLPTMETQIWRIEELGVPLGEEERIDAMLDAERSGVDANAVKAKVPSIAAAEREFVEADRLFRAYGLYACITDGHKSREEASS